jgi:hypothetical protein
MTPLKTHFIKEILTALGIMIYPIIRVHQRLERKQLRSYVRVYYKQTTNIQPHKPHQVLP